VRSLRGRTVAITGASSGIGRALAVHLAGEGCNLALATDKNEKGLKETSALAGNAVKISTHLVDVTKQDDVRRFAEEATAYHGGVDIIINNAGVSVSDFVETVPLEDFEWVMAVNFWGVVYGIQAFLPYLRQRPEGQVVNISSVGAMVTLPNHGPYDASKSAVKGVTEVLYQEMQGTNIIVTGVYPGAIKTGMPDNARFNRAVGGLSREQAVGGFKRNVQVTSAEKAAKVIIRGIKRGKLRVIVGRDARMQTLLARLAPVSAVKLGAWMGQRMVRRWAK
jgi:short-subunit dehydrogenase